MQFQGPSPACHGSTVSVTQLWAWPPGLPKDQHRGACPPCGAGQGRGRRKEEVCRTRPSYTALTLKALVHFRSSWGSLTLRGKPECVFRAVQLLPSPEIAHGVRKPGLTAAVQRGHGIQGRGLSPEAEPWEALGGPQPVTGCGSASDSSMTFF